MFVLGVFGAVLFVAVTMLAATIAMVIYAVAHYCVSVPLRSQSQQGEGSAGMKMMMKMAPSEEVAEQMNNSAGK